MRQQGEWNEVTAMAVQRDNDEERQQRVDAILQQLRREDVSPERTRKAQLPSSRTDGHRTKKPVQE